MHRLLAVIVLICVAREVHGKSYVVQLERTPVGDLENRGQQVRQFVSNMPPGKVRGEFRSLGMVAVEMSEEEAAAMRGQSSVAAVVQDVHAEITRPPSPTCSVKKHPDTWGLDRIDQIQQLPTYPTFNPAQTTYHHDPENDGQGITVYIIDTGINVDNPQFKPRATNMYKPDGVPGTNTDDNGHGTLVAGVIGSTSFGVAKKVTLKGCKALDANGSGLGSWTLDCVNWLLENAKNGDVVNLSLVVMADWGPLNWAVADLVEKGITVVAAAGNNGTDACNFSPGAASPDVDGLFSVGATNIADDLAPFSNTGRCVNILAPGVDISTTTNTNQHVLASGTSFSAPHVTGAVAVLRSKEKGKASTPQQIRIKLLESPTELSNIPDGTTNKMLYLSCDSKL